MASSFGRLRPVSDSPSPSTSTTTSSDHTPPPRHGQSQHVNLLPPASANRRPMSPTSIRDVDLSGQDRDMPARPTSGYFQREERAFFAQAGDFESNKSHLSRQSSASSHRQHWSPSSQQHPNSFAHASPRSVPPSSYPHNESARPARQGPVPLTVQPVYPASSHMSSHTSNAPMPPPPMPHRPGYPVRSPSEDHPSGPLHPMREPMAEEYRDESDESWRTPMPHNQRRRAGKHTKRVVVK
ncbi:unnamed protein product [Somion occarium]|uniref:Uncharacterized protein n=1 Tax=Somion occarium TaxID=3059160 RepID=A0ABP1CR92_9APHY